MARTIALKSVDMTTGSIPKKMLTYTIPLIIAGWLQIFYSAADLIVCGNYGSPNSVGAISATNSITYLIISVFIGFGVGANVAVSKAYGARNQANAEKIIGTTYMLAIVSSIVLAALGVSLSRVLLQALGTPEDIIDLSTTYMMIYFAGVPFNIFYNFGASLLRGMGDTLKPFLYLLISGIINVALNLLFVIVFKMDVAGVALTTVISQFISAFLVTITLIRGNGYALLRISRLRFYKNEVIDILKVGLPAGIQGSLFSISNVLIQSTINSFGAAADTGSGAANSIESFLNASQDGFAQAGVAFVGANYGAKKANRIKSSILWSLIYGVTISSILGVAIYFAASPLLQLYIDVNEPMGLESLAFGLEKLKINSITYMVFAVSVSLSQAQKGLGHSTISMIISLVGICVFRIFFIYVIFPINKTSQFLFYSYPISWALTAVGQIICMAIILPKEVKKVNAAALKEESELTVQEMDN